jgi:hypothetical protein
MSVISFNDVVRMRRSLDDNLTTTLLREKKARLRELSQERIQHWPNTLSALRKKKEMFVKNRQEKEELARQEVDRKEAELRRQLRLETIERANDMLFRQSDKMKMLKGQMAYADALHTRVRQIEEKKFSKEKIVKEEAEYHRLTMEKVAKGDIEERIKEENRKRLIDNIKVTRKEQLDDVIARRQAEKDEAEAIGIAMKRRAQQQLEEDIIAQEAKHAAAAKANADLMIANEKFKKIRDSVRLREKKEEEDREAEVKEIEFRKKARKDLAKKRFDMAQTRRQKIIDNAVELLATQASNEATLLTKQENEMREKTERAEAAKEAKRAKLWEEIVNSRNEMVHRKLDEWKKSKEDERLMSSNWRKLTEDAHQQRIDKEEEVRKNTKKIKGIQKAEAVEAARRKVRKKLEEIEEARLLMSGQDDDDKRFEQECREQIKRYHAAGKPVYTLYKALEMQAPPLLPAIKNKRPPKNEDE